LRGRCGQCSAGSFFRTAFRHTAICGQLQAGCCFSFDSFTSGLDRGRTWIISQGPVHIVGVLVVRNEFGLLFSSGQFHLIHWLTNYVEQLARTNLCQPRTCHYRLLFQVVDLGAGAAAKARKGEILFQSPGLGAHLAGRSQRGMSFFTNMFDDLAATADALGRETGRKHPVLFVDLSVWGGDSPSSPAT
jgi:hypothetical protein